MKRRRKQRLLRKTKDATEDKGMNWLQKVAAGPPTIQNYINDRRENCVGVFNAFNIKDQLKQLGFRWDNGRLAWWIPATQYPNVQMQVEQLVNVGSRGRPAPATPPPAPRTPAPAAAPSGNYPPITAEIENGNVCLNFPYGDPPARKDACKAMGFRFSGQNVGGKWQPRAPFTKIVWYKPLNQISEPDKQQLSSLNITIPGVTEAQPQQPPQQPTPAQPESPAPATGAPGQPKPWILAKRLADGVYVAVKQPATPQEPWIWEDIDLNDGSYAPEELKTQVKRESRGDQKEIRGANPDELLDPLRKQREEEERKAKGPYKPDPSQQAVIDAFVSGQENLMLNALAGTGKTSTLVYLAKIKTGQQEEINKLTEMVKAGQNPLQQQWQYINPQQEMELLDAKYDLQANPQARAQIKPRELKWFYLVFNKKNQIEGQKKFEPAGIPVKTTHSFLGELLEKSDVPDFAGQQLWGTKGEAKKYRSKERMFILLDRLLDGSKNYMLPPSFDPRDRDRSFHAKKFVRKLANLAKNYAVDPANEQEAKTLFAQLISSYDELDPLLRTKEEREKPNPNQKFVDFSEQLMKDTMDILRWSLPGKAAQLHQQLVPLRQRDIQEAQEEARRAKYSGNRWEAKQADYKLTKARRNLEKLGVLEEIGQTNYRDHNDTLWFASLPQYRDKLDWDYFDTVLADEVQDFNACQHMMIQKLAQQKMKLQGRNGVKYGPTARAVAVGDPHQALYRFRGADRMSFQKLEALLGNTPRKSKTLPLLQNHRCGEVIVRFANENTEPMTKLPPDQRLQADEEHTTNERKRGKVHTGVEYFDTLDSLSNEWNSRGNRLKQSTAFIARGNAPLAKAAIQLMQEGMDFEIIGRDFSSELVQHIADVLEAHSPNRFSQLPNPPLGELSNMLTAYAEILKERAEGDVSRQDEIKQAAEYSEAMVSMIEHLQSNNGTDPRYTDRYKRPITIQDADGFRDYLLERFKGQDLENSEKDIIAHDKIDPRTRISLTTGHRSKGLEWDRVFVINVEDFPSPNAKTEEDKIVEGNIFYVAVTRAMHTLYLVHRPPREEEEDGSRPNRRRRGRVPF
jgi:superfamily I DNA/RNA helicase